MDQKNPTKTIKASCLKNLDTKADHIEKGMLFSVSGFSANA